MTATAADANSHAVVAVEFAWASSDTLVARVDESGLVTGVAAGEVAVTATAFGVTGRAELAVAAAVPTTIAVAPDTVRFTALGQTMQVTAEVRDQLGRAMPEAVVSWSSGDTLVAAVGSTGLVTGVGRGVTTVAAAAGEAAGETSVTVMQTAGSVVVSPAGDTIQLGDTLRLVAEAFDANGHPLDEAEFTWSSSDAVVGWVDQSGLVTGMAEGSAKITATAGEASGVAEITVENPDRAALVVLYHATGGPDWTNSDNWLTDAPLGEWHGVTTDPFGRVVRLDLAGRWDSEARVWIRHGLSGSIPPELASLAQLRTLYLDSNRLTGPIPPALGGLSELRELNLQGNSLTGEIPPELGNLAELTGLHLGNNGLTGPIPQRIGDLAALESLRLFNNQLDGPVPTELSHLGGLRNLDVSGNRLEGPVPPEIGGLVELVALRLRKNQLTGEIPAEFGQLTSLEVLTLDGNPGLTGPLPVTLAGLTSLRVLNFGDSGLCAPGTTSFLEWLRSVETVWGDSCAGLDVAVLTSLYHATNGAGWHESGGWLGDGALEEWYGVSADSVGRVVALDLSRNGLAGELTRDLGDLDRMVDLRIGGNELTGSLPSSLARLSLRVFRYADTELCEPPYEPYRAWLNAIPSREGTGIDCTLLPDREILEALYQATDGPNWTHNKNWLGDASLSDWYGVEVDEGGRVVGLRLSGNNLRGPMPPELGELVNLWHLGPLPQHSDRFDPARSRLPRQPEGSHPPGE